MVENVMKLLKLLKVVFTVLYPSVLTGADIAFFHPVYPCEVMRGGGYSYTLVVPGGTIIKIEEAK